MIHIRRAESNALSISKPRALKRNETAKYKIVGGVCKFNLIVIKFLNGADFLQGFAVKRGELVLGIRVECCQHGCMVVEAT